MKIPILELQEVCKTKLDALGYISYDGLPMGEVDYPFIAFDSDSVEYYGTKAIDGVEILFPMYIWSDYTDGGSKEAKEIANAIAQDFIDKESTIVMSGFTCESVELESMRTNRQKDGMQQLTQVMLTLVFMISEN